MCSHRVLWERGSLAPISSSYYLNSPWEYTAVFPKRLIYILLCDIDKLLTPCFIGHMKINCAQHTINYYLGIICTMSTLCNRFQQ